MSDLQLKSCGQQTTTNTQQSTDELAIFVAAPLGVGCGGAAVELGVWGEGKQCLAGGSRKISWCVVSRVIRLLKFSRFLTTIILKFLLRASEQK